MDVRDASQLARRLIDSSEHIEESDLDGHLLMADLLPAWYDDWVLIERERFRQLRLHALESLCERLVARNEIARAVEAGAAAVAGEPLRESAHRALIRAHLAEGNLSEALRQYQTYRRLAREELGVQPSPVIEGLVRIALTPAHPDDLSVMRGSNDGRLAGASG